MNKMRQESPHYQLIETAIAYLVKNQARNPNLSEVAQAMGLSEFHFQRIFKKWAGVSPKNLLQYLTLEKAKRSLIEGRDVLNASLDAGLSGPGRLHDLFIKFEAMSPGEYKTKGLGLVIDYGFVMTPFGNALLGVTERGICHLHFVQRSERQSLAELKARFPLAEIKENNRIARKHVQGIFEKNSAVQIFATGTPFQLKVWEALLRIPEGCVVSYQEIAALAGNPRASRAVGTAIGSNSIAFLIPCHRVIRANGVIGDYRWGAFKKHSLICFESARKEEK